LKNWLGERLRARRGNETVASSLGYSWGETPPVHRWFQNLNTPGDLKKAALEELPFIH
jgi:hypothetical protein